MARIHTCVLSKDTLAKDLIPMKKDFSINIQAIVLKNGTMIVTSSHIV